MPDKSPARTRADYKGDLKPVWCAGCGDYGALAALQDAAAARNLDPDRIVIVSGIGCSGRISGFFRAYGFHGVHGRGLPTALGVKIANPELTVIVVGGDGDGFSIGGGHVPHAARRNPDITYLVLDNEIYGLTKGQISPTSPAAHVTDTTPYGAAEQPVNILAMCISYDVSFVARGFSGRPKPLADLIGQAIDHRGFSVVQILSPCPTFHDTYDPMREAVIDLPPDHDPTDRLAAFRQAYRTDALPLGVFYRNERPTYGERLAIAATTAAVRIPATLGELLDRYAQ